MLGERARWRGLAVFVAMAVACGACVPHRTVRLYDGTIVRGEVASEDEDAIYFERASGGPLRRVARSDIEAVGPSVGGPIVGYATMGAGAAMVLAGVWTRAECGDAEDCALRPSTASGLLILIGLGIIAAGGLTAFLMGGLDAPEDGFEPVRHEGAEPEKAPREPSVELTGNGAAVTW